MNSAYGSAAKLPSSSIETMTSTTGAHHAHSSTGSRVHCVDVFTNAQLRKKRSGYTRPFIGPNL